MRVCWQRWRAKSRRTRAARSSAGARAFHVKVVGHVACYIGVAMTLVLTRAWRGMQLDSMSRQWAKERTALTSEAQARQDTLVAALEAADAQVRFVALAILPQLARN